MDQTLQIRLRAASQALGGLVDRQSRNVPPHLQCQVTSLNRNLNKFRDSLPVLLGEVTVEVYDAATDEPIQATAEDIAVEVAKAKFHVVDVASESLGNLVRQLQRGPIMKTEVAAAAKELEPLMDDMNAERNRLFVDLFGEPDYQGGSLPG